MLTFFRNVRFMVIRHLLLGGNKSGADYPYEYQGNRESQSFNAA